MASPRLALLKGVTDSPELDLKWLSEAANGDEALLDSFIARRQKGEPVAKIIGSKGFWKQELKVSTATLDPRPDSETLIEAVLKHFPDRNQPLRILDLGTGSGCLLIALLGEYPNATGIGMDASAAALQVAEQNVNQYVPNRARLICRSWIADDWWQDLGGFDVVVSNPPYIPSAQIASLDKDVRDYDPLQALDGGQDGLRDYRILAASVGEVLKQNGMVFFEIGQWQYIDVTAIMEAQKFTLKDFLHDLGGVLRVLAFEKK